MTDEPKVPKLQLGGVGLSSQSQLSQPDVTSVSLRGGFETITGEKVGIRTFLTWSPADQTLVERVQVKEKTGCFEFMDTSVSSHEINGEDNADEHGAPASRINGEGTAESHQLFTRLNRAVRNSGFKIVRKVFKEGDGWKFSIEVTPCDVSVDSYSAAAAGGSGVTTTIDVQLSTATD